MYLGSMGMYHVGGDVTYCLASNTYYLSTIRRLMEADKGAPRCAQALEDICLSHTCILSLLYVITFKLLHAILTDDLYWLVKNALGIHL